MASLPLEEENHAVEFDVFVAPLGDCRGTVNCQWSESFHPVSSLLASHDGERQVFRNPVEAEPLVGFVPLDDDLTGYVAHEDFAEILPCWQRLGLIRGHTCEILDEVKHHNKDRNGVFHLVFFGALQHSGLPFRPVLGFVPPDGCQGLLKLYYRIFKSKV